MLTRNRSTDRDAKIQDLFSGDLRFFQLAFFSRIERQDGMHISVACMKYIADRNAVLLSNLLNSAQRFRDLRSRHHAILNVIGWTHAPDCSKRILAALPQQVAFSGGLRHSYLPGPASATNIGYL